MPRLPEELEKGLSASAFRLYAFLCREMFISTAPDLRFSNKEISSRVSIRDGKTLSRARKELQDAGLIRCRKIPPGIYSHIILDQHGDPICAPKGRRGIRHYDPITSTVRAASALIDAKKKNPRGVLQEQQHSAETKIVSSKDCRVHGISQHWSRNGKSWTCEKCHPYVSSEPFRVPNSKEIGFS